VYRTNASILIVGSTETPDGIAGSPHGAAAKQGPASDAFSEAGADEGECEGFIGALRPQQQDPSRHRMPHAHEWPRPPPSSASTGES
jgi:hypothetical protein